MSMVRLADPNRLYASQHTEWFGQEIQRSNDGGKTWETVGKEFDYVGKTGTHQWYDGTSHPWEFKRVWHLEPSLDDPDTVFAGVEDAAIFKQPMVASPGSNCPDYAPIRPVTAGCPAPAACACTRSSSTPPTLAGS